jgi:hypothetical protein
MKILISLSAGRTQKWFDSLTKKDQKQYLLDHPNSKFGKSVVKSIKIKSSVDKPKPTSASTRKHALELRNAISDATANSGTDFEEDYNTMYRGGYGAKSAYKPTSSRKKIESLLIKSGYVKDNEGLYKHPQHKSEFEIKNAGRGEIKVTNHYPSVKRRPKIRSLYD